MGQPSHSPDETARKSASILLQRLAPAGTQAAMAVSLGVSEATVSRMKDQIEPLMKMAAQCGLKLVDAERICLRKEEISFLRDTYSRVADQAPWLLNEADC